VQLLVSLGVAGRRWLPVLTRDELVQGEGSSINIGIVQEGLQSLYQTLRANVVWAFGP
jgi:hypothetical protein